MPKTSPGLSPKLYKGLSKKRMAKKGGNFNRVQLKQGDSAIVQFLEEIDEFLEYEIHTFRDGSRWQYVPCAGDDCPLCADEDPEVSKTSYRFCCNVYHFKEKKVLILEGPKDLAGRIAHRYEKGKKNFLRKVYEVSKFATTPVSYDVEAVDPDDQRPARTDGMERHDLTKYVTDAMTSYFGDDLPAGGSSKSKGPSSLDDDDWDEDEEDDEDYTEAELRAMGPKELKTVANDLGVNVKKVTKENRKKVISAVLKRQ